MSRTDPPLPDMPPPAPAPPHALSPSRRSSAIAPFHVMRVMRRANLLDPTSALPVLHLEIGQPSHPPPPAATAAAMASLQLPSSQQGYTCAAGLPTLRAAISRHYHRRHRTRVPPEAILVTSGSSAAFTALFPALFDPADRVALSVPGYPCYRNVLAAFGVRVVPLRTRPSTGHQPSLAQLRAAHAHEPLRGLILASPGNPTGTVLSEERIREIVAWAAAERVRVVVDEIYHCVVRRPAVSAVRFDSVIVVSSLSKFWCLPGMRVGWIVVRCEETRAAVVRMLQSMQIAAPTVAQHAAEAALGEEGEDGLEDVVRGYLSAADELVGVLRGFGFEEVEKPDGAFYVWAGCEAVCHRVGVRDASELCDVLLEKVRVAVTPGIDFDPEKGDMFVRFSCAGGAEIVREAEHRIAAFIRESAG